MHHLKVFAGFIKRISNNYSMTSLLSSVHLVMALLTKQDPSLDGPYIVDIEPLTACWKSAWSSIEAWSVSRTFFLSLRGKKTISPIIGMPS